MYKNASKFYQSYDIDAYIMNLLFDYKVLQNKKCGFPDSAITKVINKLEQEKISYQIIYFNKDPLVKDYRKLNKYDKYYNLALKNISINERIDFLIDNIKQAKPDEIEKILESLESCLK